MTTITANPQEDPIGSESVQSGGNFELIMTGSRSILVYRPAPPSEPAFIHFDSIGSNHAAASRTAHALGEALQGK